MGLRTATLWALLAATLAAAPAAAQFGGGQSSFGAPASSAPAVSTAAAISLGTPLSVTGGPWVLNSYLFFSGGKIQADYAWRDKLHGLPGQIYTSSDLQGDMQALGGLNAFNRITPSVYAITNMPVPPQFASISVSTNQVRVVFDVDVKGSTAPVKPRLVTPPSAVSGLILTPTAFRGAGRFNTPGMGLDFNAVYFIGRLYGKNAYANAPEHTNYIDRIGLWTLSADGKMQLQSDGAWRPAVAVGGQALFMFRDSPQPTVATPAVSVKVNAKTTQLLTDGYVVVSKDWRGVRASAGLMQGSVGNLVGNLSEFLTPEALHFYAGQPSGTVDVSHSVPFANALYLLKPDFPIGVEYLKFNGAPSNPYMVNFKLGRLLHLNFDLSYLHFRGGYELLGLFQFRYNQFPNK